MLKKLTIKNFKAIQDMTIEFTPLTVLIGGNACGKSTVLQALDFLRILISNRDITKGLEDVDLYFSDLKSKYNDGPEKPIGFIAVLKLDANNSTLNLEWSITIDELNDKWKISEKVIDIDRNKVLCSYGNDDLGNYPSILDQIQLKSSALNILIDMIDLSQELSELIHYLHSTQNIGLLSVDKIRNEHKEFFMDIQSGGEWLFSFIYRLPDDQRKEIDTILSDLLGYQIKVETEKTVSGMIYLWIVETRNGTSASIHSSHLSDGLLRLLALIALGTQKYKDLVLVEGYTHVFGMLLLDEIENGINPYLTEKVIGLFKTIIENTSRQVIITTHSPIILNDISPEEIVFLWKDRAGSVHCKNMFSTEEMRDALAFLNPGEIWENFGKETILQKLNISEDNK